MGGSYIEYTVIHYILFQDEWRRCWIELHLYGQMCRRNSLYRMDNCLQKRLKAHNEGKNGAKYTKAKRPVSLVYYEGFRTKEEAMRREYQIKQLTREKKLGLMEF